MEDLSDLVWKSAGVAKPSSSSSTPLNHLSNPSSKSQSPLNNTLRPNLSSSPQTQQSYNPNSNSFTAPRNASPMANYSIPQSAFQQSSPSQVPLNQNSFTSASTPSKMQSNVSSMANSNVSAGKKDDLFGNLVSFGGNSSSGKQNLANMSLAEQVKLKQQQQQQSQNRVNSVSAADQLFLDSLGGSGGGGVTSQFQQSQPRPTTPQGRINQSSPMTHSPQTPPFSSLSSSNKVSPAQSPGSPHQFKLHQSTANVTQQQTTASSAAAWDFDLLAGNNNTSQISTLSTNVTKQPSVAAANIDQSFATFGTPVASSQNQKAEMDLLGDFKSPPSISQLALNSKPSTIPTKPATANANDPFAFLPESVKTTPPQPQLPQTPKSTVQPTNMAQSSPNGTASSDNVDHLVAKMMEMGFDSESSLKALRSTNGNLQSAVDMLVNGKVTPKGAPVDSPRERKYSDTNDDDDSDLYRQKQKYYEGGSPTSGRRYGNDDKSGSAQQKLSQLGTSVFSKASSVLSKAKEKVASKVEEVKEAGGAAAVLSNVVGVVQSKVDTFKGSPARGKESEDAFAKYSGGYSDYSDTFQDKPTYNGFSDFKETPQPPANNVASSVAQSQPAPSPPKPKISRPPFIPIESAILDLVKSAKNSGNESYKLGQFADAVTHYSTAINYLPPNHVMLIQLYNNRAAAELKTGEYKTCIADCDLVQTIITYYGGLSVSSSGEDDSDTKIVDSSTETSITISDLVKSLVRKGTALEAIEKYNDAKEVYREVLLKFDSKNKLANEGVSRCSKALAPSNPPPSVPQPSSSSSQPAPSNSNPKDELLSMFDTTSNSFSGSSGINSGIASQLPAEKQSTVDVNASKAVQEIRAQEKANEIEAEEKLRLKDYIDAKILAWKAGKEANLRALLSSLETVLWEELKWTKTNLSELITPNQVKVRYMKAIAKIHPDKIPSTETTEHKLIANAVFSILNDAWDSFKAQNNMV